MAGSVNKVILVGNLGADPEIRRTQDGRPIANLRIATSESWKDKTSKLLVAAQGLPKGGPEALAKYKQALECKACHSVHRPPQ